MKKKLSQLKNNPNLINVHFPSKSLAETPKEERLHLPKIKSIDYLRNQKTLISLINRIELFIQEPTIHVPEILNQCLIQLRQTLKKEAISSSVVGENTNCKNLKQNGLETKQEWGTKSQVMSIKRAKIKKVENRDLFEKVSEIRVEQETNVTRVSDKEVIQLLRRRISEKDNVIQKLHDHIQELRLQKGGLQKQIEGLKQSQKQLQLIKLCSDQEIFEKVKELNAAKLKNKLFSDDLADKDDQIYSLSSRNCALLAKLNQREDQIVSVWQIALSKQIL